MNAKSKLLDVHMHAMRMPNQSVEEAAGLTVTFITQKVAEYKTLTSQGKTDAAYEALGMAMHPLMDSTSPTHERYQEWPGVIPLFNSGIHLLGEWKISDEKLTKSSDILRNFYDKIRE